MRLRAGIVLAVAALLATSCQTPIDTGDTWLLAAATTTEFAPKSLVFRNVETDERYTVRFRSLQAGMIPVPAGRYVLHRVDSFYDNAFPMRLGSAVYEFDVRAGHVNEWGILRMEKIRERTGSWVFRIGVGHDDVLRNWARERRPEILARVPIQRVGSGTRVPIVELVFEDCPTEVSDRFVEDLSSLLGSIWAERQVRTARTRLKARLRVDANGLGHGIQILQATTPEAEQTFRDVVKETVLPEPPGEGDCSMADRRIVLVLESKPAKP